MKLRAFQRQIGYCITPVLAYAVVYAWLKGACPQWWFTEVLERLIPVVMGLAGAGLAYVFNRRNSYLTGLPSLWRQLVKAVQGAIHYTKVEADSEQFQQVKKGLSTAIDEVRGHFGNIGEDERTGGLYPLEPLKRIYCEFERLDPANEEVADASGVREQMVRHWKDLRAELLPEFDRA